ncbi:MAG: 23S rRNA (uracil(1939)-C(5))-methyltransferase RlmD [Oscillospiraceae bacterium]
MTKNDIVTLEITALTSEGSGVARLDGMVVFTPFTAVGDVVEARLVKCLKSYCYAKIERIITSSPDRVENTCPAFGKCGGCTFRHISYEAELRAKDEIVRSAFERIGGLSPEFLPIIGSENSERYRNKLQMPLAKQPDGTLACGFFSERSHRVIPIEDCALQPKIFSEITHFVLERMRELRISVYNEEKHEGVVRHIFLRKGHQSGEICVVLVARRKVPEFDRLAHDLRAQFPEITGVVLNINPDKTNVILGEREILLSGKPEISDTMCGVPVEISPKSFYQVNTPAAENLYRQAAEFAQPSGKLLLDLYCGAGTIGLSMAKEASKIIGAEIVPEAVENAKQNAARCGITNAEFICADAGQAAQQLAERGLKPDVILLDPPRKGCGEEALSACVSMQPERIVMISCNPATAAKDCRFLSENGYEVQTVRAFDLFPRTKHTECVCLLNRE